MQKLAAAAVPLLLIATAAVQHPVFEPYQPDLAAAATLSNAVADFNGDGALDLFVGFNGAPNRLYRNDRGTLKEVAATAGLADARATRAAAWADFDADGDPDLLLGFVPGDAPVLRLYRNDNGQFQDVTAPLGLTVASGAVRQPVWIDFDGDDDLDLFVAFRDRANALYRNDRGRFSDVAASVGLADGRKTVGAVWFDYDQDGDLDLYAANQDGDANALYRNDDGRFVDVAEAAGLAWGGRAPGDPANGTVRPCTVDVDGDGRFDIFTANYGRNGLFLNRAGGRFSDVSSAWKIAVDGRFDTCAIGDFDNDGRADIYVNGTISAGVSYRDYLLRNTGSRFDDVTAANLLAVPASHGALWADFDADGDVDLTLAGITPDPLALVWRNLLEGSGARRALRVRVVDPRGRATRAGAEVRVYAAGTRRLIAARLVDAGSGYNAQSDAAVHLGVGAARRVDVEVVFPGHRRREIVRAAGIETGRTDPLVVRVPVSSAPNDAARPVPDVIFVPTRESVADEMLTLAAVTSRDVVYDLGSGDGRIVMLAAQKYGARGVGIELDPKLVALAREVARDGDMQDRVTFINGDLFDADISSATLVTIYLSPSVNARLEPKLRRQLRPGTRIVSHQFPIGQWPPEKTVRAEDGTLLYLWTTPARQSP